LSMIPFRAKPRYKPVPFFAKCGRMSSPSSTQLVIGMIIGGSIISSVGAAATYYTQSEKPKLKGIMRDFIIGAILILVLLQLIPDSMNTFFTGVQDVVSSGLPMLKGGEVPDMELQTGVPGF
jgi:hypothetical protein